LARAVDEALRQALVNLQAIPAPQANDRRGQWLAWNIAARSNRHGLEALHRKKTSAFAGPTGQRVAAPGVTVGRRRHDRWAARSLSIDDEGTPRRAPS